MSSAIPHPNCSICRQLFIKPSALKCGHVFCGGCLCRWLKRQRCCPLCRWSVPLRWQPIQLRGLDETLEGLAGQLPPDQRDERHSTKRQSDRVERSERAKRRRMDPWSVTTHPSADLETDESVQPDIPTDDQLEDELVSINGDNLLLEADNAEEDSEWEDDFRSEEEDNSDAEDVFQEVEEEFPLVSNGVDSIVVANSYQQSPVVLLYNCQTSPAGFTSQRYWLRSVLSSSTPTPPPSASPGSVVPASVDTGYSTEEGEEEEDQD